MGPRGCCLAKVFIAADDGCFLMPLYLASYGFAGPLQGPFKAEVIRLVQPAASRAA